MAALVALIKRSLVVLGRNCVRITALLASAPQMWRTLIRHTRHWLTTTIAALTLTAMSLVVSWKAVKVSERAEEFTEAQISPIFHIESTTLYEGDLFGPQSGDDKRLSPSIAWLSNDGQPTLRWELRFTTFFGLKGKGAGVRFVPLNDPIVASLAHSRGSESVVQAGRLAALRELRFFSMALSHSSICSTRHAQRKINWHATLRTSTQFRP